tara:strand:- start:70 stop:369 length:300 start_codon:yes stop_codon:yes gene_type:complete
LRAAFRTSPKVVLLAVLFAVAVGIYAYGAARSPLTSELLERQQKYVRLHTSLRRMELRARAYWDRNPDVWADPYFGESGAEGTFGAWVHYERHGRAEGR